MGALGYNAIRISTVVDKIGKHIKDIGYNAIRISTVVDRNEAFGGK